MATPEPGLNELLDIVRAAGRARPGPEWYTASELAKRIADVSQSVVYHRLMVKVHKGELEMERRGNVIYFRAKKR